MKAGGRRLAFAGLLAGATAWIALRLLGFDSDGAFAVYDGIWNGMGAERFPRQSISPHHPLFQVFVVGATAALGASGVEHPGHVAARVISGAGACWLLIQIAMLAGARRPGTGFLFALLVLATRGFVLETAAGENVIAAAAAALFALTTAVRPGSSLVRTGAALSFALLMRQDNLFVVPAATLAVAAGRPPGERLGAVVRLIVATGLVTLLLYAVAWMVATDGSMPLPRWLVGLGTQSWTGSGVGAPTRWSWYLSSAAVAAAGQHWPTGGHQPWLGVALLGVIPLAGLLIRGAAWRRDLVLPIAITLAGRAFFHVWYEADNFEWLVLPIAFLAALASGLSAGEPATPRGARTAGGILIAALCAVLVILHGPSTWSLRQRLLMSAIEEAAGEPRPSSFLAQGERPATGVLLLGASPRKLEDFPHEVGRSLAVVDAAVPDLRDATAVILTDRLVKSGMPYTVAHRGAMRTAFDDRPDTPWVRHVRRDGITLAIRVLPRGPESR